MDAKQIIESEEFKKCADFHGHICPGLSTGYKAAEAAMKWLEENRSVDEEIIAIVETDACSADAVQVLTGCTFGKGNFIFRDYGKQVLILLSRNTGKGVRVSIKGNAGRPDEEHMALIKKMISGSLTNEEQIRFQELHLMKSKIILETPAEELFNIEETTMQLPQKARIEPSVNCEICGEPVMKTKMESVNGKMICRGCLS